LEANNIDSSFNHHICYLSWFPIKVPKFYDPIGASGFQLASFLEFFGQMQAVVSLSLHLGADVVALAHFPLHLVA